MGYDEKLSNMKKNSNISLMYNNYPDCIRTLNELMDDENIVVENLSVVDEILNKIEIFLLAEYNFRFKNKKELNENYIQENIFSSTPDKITLNQYIKINLTSITRVFYWLIDQYQEFKKSFEPTEIKTYNLRKELFPFYYLMDDFMQFYANNRLDYLNAKFPIVMTRTWDNFGYLESIYLSELLLKGNLNEIQHYSVHNVSQGSISLIRQTIELILKDTLKLRSIRLKSGKDLKISPYIFLEFIKENQDKISYPIELSIIRKIYEWSNFFIHGGIVSYYWILMEAQIALYSFYPQENRTPAIQIEPSFWDRKNGLLVEFLERKLNIKGSDFIIL